MLSAEMPSIKFYSFLCKHRKYAPKIIDVCSSVISYFIPFAISGLEYIKLEIFLNTVLIYATVFILTFFIMKVYKNMWRFSGIEDIFRCLIASFAANIIFYVITKLLYIRIFLYVYLIAFAMSSLSAMSARIIYRAILIVGNRKEDCYDRHINTMIIGAGQATATMLNEIKSNFNNHYVVRCILDDDKSKIGRDINFVPVVGDTSKIIEMAEKYNIEEIIISESSLNKLNKSRIFIIAANTKCKIKILPDIYSLISNKHDIELVGKLRAIRLDDLLGRDPIILDCEMTKDSIKGKVVLVTGGGGSIGSELCRQISSYEPKKLIILDEYENNAYAIQQELIRTFGDKLNMEIEIASVRDKSKLDKLFSMRNIDIVFHAAAHKHVPLMENNPEEAIKNNIIGTYNTVLMADKYKVEKFVLISTDKAVNPTNVMGATKRICEMIIQSFDKRSCTDYVAVRFGNVLGSNGSVIPLFMDQIKIGGPVTVTHEEITRYFMTIPEAVKLVLKAFSIGKGGEIFVLDMGEPVKIKDLAYQLIMLSGFIPDVDIKIEYTGLRPGEKLYEELIVTKNDGQTSTDIEKIFIEKPFEINERELFESIKLLREAADKENVEMEFNIIEKLVPTYKRTPNIKKASG